MRETTTGGFDLSRLKQENEDDAKYFTNGC